MIVAVLFIVRGVLEALSRPSARADGLAKYSLPEPLTAVNNDVNASPMSR